MAATETDLDEDFASLDIKCTSTKCESNLHCFRPKKPRKTASRKAEGQLQPLLFEELRHPASPGQVGDCRSCGIQLVDWERIHKRNLADAAYTVEMLKLELWRRYYWGKQIDQWALNRARRRGRTGLRVEAQRVVRNKLAVANPPRDGRQTPRERNVIWYAQHATGTCCRRCLSYWHGIEKGRDLTDEEITCVLDWIQLYIGQRLPDLPENGEKVPYIRKKKLNPKG